MATATAGELLLDADGNVLLKDGNAVCSNGVDGCCCGQTCCANNTDATHKCFYPYLPNATGGQVLTTVSYSYNEDWGGLLSDSPGHCSPDRSFSGTLQPTNQCGVWRLNVSGPPYTYEISRSATGVWAFTVPFSNCAYQFVIRSPETKTESNDCRHYTLHATQDFRSSQNTTPPGPTKTRTIDVSIVVNFPSHCAEYAAAASGTDAANTTFPDESP